MTDHFPPGARALKPCQRGSQKIIVTVLIAVAVAVFLLLPQFVSEPWVNVEPLPGAEAPARTELSPSDKAQKTKYRQDAQFLLAKILKLRDQLQAQQVSDWAGFAFSQALQQVEQGDEQYGRGDYAESLDSYQQAHDQLEAVVAMAEQKLAQALVDGEAAVEASQLTVAEEAAALAQAIAPDDPAVQQLAARVEVLPALIEQLQQGQTLQAAGQLEPARQAFQQAVALDGQHRTAAEALAAIAVAITDQQFGQLMSAGYRALDAEQFEQASRSFQQAGKVDADNPAVQQALAQVASRKSQLWVSRQLAKADRFEQQEQWQQAVDIYRQMLATEPSLTEVSARLLPATIRATLDQQLSKTLQEPLKLSFQSNYNRARALLDDARSIASPGPQLREQIATLQRQLKQSQIPVEVELVSDLQTEVTLFRVARLGYFERKTLSLKAGQYVAAGSRKGYRDVRVTFTISGEPLDSPIVVRCTEPI